MTFLRDTWYVAAWDHEVPQDELFQRPCSTSRY